MAVVRLKIEVAALGGALADLLDLLLYMLRRLILLYVHFIRGLALERVYLKLLGVQATRLPILLCCDDIRREHVESSDCFILRLLAIVVCILFAHHFLGVETAAVILAEVSDDWRRHQFGVVPNRILVVSRLIHLFSHGDLTPAELLLLDLGLLVALIDQVGEVLLAHIDLCVRNIYLRSGLIFPFNLVHRHGGQIVVALSNRLIISICLLNTWLI